MTGSVIGEVNEEVIDALFAGAAGLDFFQAVRLLDARFPGALGAVRADTPGVPRIAIRPHDGLAFPASDVHSTRRRDGERPALDLIVTFLGLYGVDSPLPSYFGSAAGEEEARALRDFLDIFNHRLYVLLYESWRKYRLALGTPALDAVNERRLLCLAGLGAPAAAEEVPRRALIPFAALLRNRVRNAEGLRRLVQDGFPGIRVRIVENVPRWVDAHERPRLGRGAAPAVLGETTLLGERLLDVTGRFRVVLGPLGWPEFGDFHPGRASARRLAELIALYAPDGLEYDVELRIDAGELPVTRLGCPSNRLGLTTWSGRPTHTMVSELVEYAALARPAARRGRSALE